MNLQLIRNGSERNIINKTLTTIGTETAIMKQDSSIIHPIFIMAYSPTYIQNINYAYCEETKRYYFVDGIESMTGGRVLLRCTVDVLETYKKQILAQTAIIDKAQGNALANKYINDNSLVVSEQTFNRIKNFPSGFNQNGEFILITAGAQ